MNYGHHKNALCLSPKACREAIDLGLELYQQAKFAEAIEMWQKSLKLPGSGAMRLSGTVREFRLGTIFVCHSL